MWYCNAVYFAGEEGFVRGSFCVEDGKFTHISRDDFPPGSEKECMDLHGNNVIPGLVDIHVHGAMGDDFSDGRKEGLISMARCLLGQGTTSFMPTSMTLPYERLEKAFRTAAEVKEEAPEGAARIIGIHMEGPFLSERKCGAQNRDYLKLPDTEAFRSLQEQCGNLVRIVDVAPELKGAVSFAKEASKLCRVSAAHTAADYEEAHRFFEAGAGHLTHLFNAMTPVHHRDPGVIGAASERGKVTAELICDGLHVHPAAVKMAFKLFPGRICLITDALRCMGMPEGYYELGGQKVRLDGGAARLEDGTLAGAASSLFQDMKNAILYGVPAGEAINAATINPARAAGWDDRIGSIEEGKYADFLICDKNLNLKQVVAGHS